MALLVSGACLVHRPVLLSTGSHAFNFGPDAGAGNAVKLCGNFLIASCIEALGEAMALAESQGLDRKQVEARANPSDPTSERRLRVAILCGAGGGDADEHDLRLPHLQGVRGPGGSQGPPPR